MAARKRNYDGEIRLDGIRRSADLLPHELWAKIFASLPLGDRKSVRLGCRRFHEVLNCVRFQKDEKFVLPNYGVLQWLSGCDRKLWNLQLTRVHLKNAHMLQFFQAHGANIRSLTLDKCELAPRIFRGIVEHCHNLHQIALVFDSSVDIGFYANLFDDLRIIREDKLIRDSVSEVNVEVPSNLSWLDRFSTTNGDFLVFYDVFPSIENLNLTVHGDVIPDHIPPTFSISSRVNVSWKYALSGIGHEFVKSAGMQNVVKRTLERLMKELLQKSETPPVNSD